MADGILEPIGGGGGLAAITGILAGGSSNSTTPGDVEPLRRILAGMEESMTPEGMQALIDSIFQQGFEQNMPTLLNAANTTGIRPQDSSTQQLMTNDLIARLTGQAAGALQTQQSNAGNVASAIAQATQTQSQRSRSPIESLLGLVGIS